MRTEDGSIAEFGDFERFRSRLISPPPCRLAMYSGEEDLAFRLLWGEGEDPELREEAEECLRLSPLSLLDLLPCWFLLLERDLGTPGMRSLSLDEDERDDPDE